jgi:hypothetical protein
MIFNEFKQSLLEKIPVDVSLELQSLWHDAKGDWKKAHTVVQDLATPEAAWVHARAFSSRYASHSFHSIIWSS